jgi:uroporphyrin-III C-methyltransferase
MLARDRNPKLPMKTGVLEALPILFKCEGRTIAVAGGGELAARLAGIALRAGAHVKVFSTGAGKHFDTFASDERFRRFRRPFRLDDLAGCSLLFAVAEDTDGGSTILELAKKANVPVSLLGAPGLSDFSLSPGVLDGCAAEPGQWAAAGQGVDYRAAEREDQPSGEVYLVGAGPGDPDLLTFRALSLMRRADAVLYDRLLPSAILNLVRREAERIYVGKQPDDHILPQADITALMIKLARQGKRVLRLKGGDPFMFGRGGEEIEALAAASIPFQAVPGITAANGCAAYAGIPLTHRDFAQACVFVTGHAKTGRLSLDWKVLVQPRQTVVIFMGLGHLAGIMREFIEHGGDPNLPAAVVDNGTLPDQRVIVATVAALADRVAAAKLKGPALIIMGHVVSLRSKLIGEENAVNHEIKADPA